MAFGILHGCGMVALKLQSCHSQLTLYACSTPNAVCVALPEDEHVMLGFIILIYCDAQ
jgi:hypothetical protein